MTTSVATRLTRMKADTFRARLRLGMGFPGPVHVPEDLKLKDVDVTELCDVLCVDGHLDLAGCASLTTLPGRLIVRGRLTIDGCTAIEMLPDTLREVFGFSAAGCHRLSSIEPIRASHGSVDLRGCSSMAALPATFTAVGKMKLGAAWIDDESVFVEGAFPDAMLVAAVGRKIGELISHPLLRNHPVLDAAIDRTLEMECWNGTLFFADTSALMHKAAT